MTELITAAGRVIECDSVARGRQYPFLYIHTAALSYGEAGTLFADPAETETLTAVENFTVADGDTTAPAQARRVYRGYTDLSSIQRSPLIDNAAELLIILQRPPEDEEE